MASTIIGTLGRKFTIDGTNRHQPESVFISGARAFTMEFDKEKFIEAVCEEFSLTRTDMMCEDFGLAHIEQRPLLHSA